MDAKTMYFIFDRAKNLYANAVENPVYAPMARKWIRMAARQVKNPEAYIGLILLADDIRLRYLKRV